jgi:hypothetical protein
MPVSNRLSDADANNLLDIILSHSASAFPTTWYFALVTMAPTGDTGAGAVEVTGGSYARVAVVANLTNFPAAAARAKAAIAAIQWPTATADWAAGTTKVVGVAMYDAATVGVYRGYGALATSVNVLTGGAPVIAAGAFSMTA